jgi:hypothetical protein
VAQLLAQSGGDKPPEIRLSCGADHEAQCDTIAAGDVAGTPALKKSTVFFVMMKSAAPVVAASTRWK